MKKLYKKGSKDLNNLKYLLVYFQIRLLQHITENLHLKTMAAVLLVKI